MSEYADLLKRFRVFPRLFSVLFIYLVFQVARWFMNLEMPTTEQAAFASMMAGTGAAWFKFYVDGGMDH